MRHIRKYSRFIEMIQKTNLETFLKKRLRINDNFQVKIKIPRTSSRQILRVNINTKSVGDYYRISLFIQYLETFANNLNEKCIKHASRFNSSHSLFSKNELDDDYMTLINYYQDDLGNRHPAILSAEYKL